MQLVKKTFNYLFVANNPLSLIFVWGVLYHLMLLLPMKKNFIVYDSYWGRQYACSPKAIYLEFQNSQNPSFENLFHIWSLNNLSVNIDYEDRQNVIKVKSNSLKYWYYMAISKYFIQNANLPNLYHKRKGQIEIATFHGTFLKKMGLDEGKSPLLNRRLLKRNSRWDYAISPSPYMTDKIKTTQKPENAKILEIGYPRNDVLYRQSGHHTSKDSLPTVLYVPTYRANGEQTDSEVYLDIPLLKKQLGTKYNVISKMHYFDEYSNIPIEELYLRADILITDYSSVMFDYAHLKKPQIFYAKDLDSYKKTRGLYLNYSEVMPGPVFTNQNGLTQYLLANTPDVIQSTFESKIEEFYEVYCTFGRGDSAKTLLKIFY